MADLTTQIMLDLGVKGNDKLKQAFKDIAAAQEELITKNEEGNKANEALAATFAKQQIELQKLGKTLKDASLDQGMLNKAMRGSKVHTAVATKTLSDYISKEKQAAAIRKQGKKTVEGLKLELRHYGVKVKQVTGWERLRKQALKGNITAQKLLRKEVDKAILAQKRQSRTLKDSIFGFRNLRNETEGSTMAFSVFRSKLLLASFAMGMYARTIGKFLALADEQHKAEAQVSRAILTTGFAAGQTLTSIRALGSEMQKLTGISDALIIKSSAVLLTFTNIAGTAFPRAMKIAVDLSKAFDQDLKQSVIQVGKALNDPILGLTALRRIGVSFNETQKEQVKGFMEINDLASAQAVIFAELEKEVGGVAEAMSKTPLERFNKSMADLSDIGETVGDGFAYMLSPFQSIFEVLVRWTKEDIEFIGKLVGKQQIQEFESRTEAVKAGIKGVKDLIVDAGSEARKSKFFEDVISDDFVSQLKMMKSDALATEEGFKKFTEMIMKARFQINAATGDYKAHNEEIAESKEAYNKVTKSYEDQLAIAMQTTEADKAKIKEALKLGVAMKDLDPAIVKVIDDWFNYKNAVKEAKEVQKDLNKLLDATVSAQKDQLEMDLLLIQAELAKAEALEGVSVDTSRYTDAIAMLEEKLAKLGESTKKLTDLEKDVKSALEATTSAKGKRMEATLAEMETQRNLIELQSENRFRTAEEIRDYNLLTAAIDDHRKKIFTLYHPYHEQHTASQNLIASLNEEMESYSAVGAILDGFASSLSGLDFSALDSLKEAMTLDMEDEEKGLENQATLLQAQLDARESFYGQMGEMAVNFLQQEAERNSAAIKSELDRDLNALKETRAYKRADDKEKARLEKEYTDKANKKIKKQHMIQQTATIASIWMDAYKASFKAVGAAPFSIGQPWMGIILGLAATQTAMVAAQKAPTFAQGGDFIVPPGYPNDSFPMRVESGERVQITPKSQTSATAPAQSIVSVNFSGNVLSQDFIEDEAIPMIKEAIRRGADIGVA